MKQTIAISAIIVLLFFAISCRKVVHREVNCRAFGLTDEPYWFPSTQGDTIKFTNGIDSIRNYVVVDSWINHRNKYTSDTGCGCLDISSMLLTCGPDSLWFNTSITYVEDQPGIRYEDVVFVMGESQSSFYETHRTLMDIYTVSSIVLNDVRRYERDFTELDKVKKVFMVRNLGIVKFELVNGDVWTNMNLTNPATINQSMFDYSENICQ